MSELWTDKKRGYGGGVSPDAKRLSFVARQLEDLGKLSIKKATSEGPDGTTIVKRFGMFEKQKYYPTAAEVAEKELRKLISIRFTSIETKWDFVAAANARKTDLNRHMNFATYYKNYFIPDILVHYQSLVGHHYKPGTFFPVVFSQAEADYLKAPFEYWRDYEYWPYVMAISAEITAWNYLIDIANYAPALMYLTYDGGPDPAYDQYQVKLCEDAVMHVICDTQVGLQPAITSPVDEASASVASHVLWDSLTYSKSPIYFGSFGILTISDVMTWGTRGCLGNDNMLYLVTRDCQMSLDLPVELPEDVQLNVSLLEGGVRRHMYKYPSSWSYLTFYFPLTEEFGEEIAFPLEMRVSGTINTIPADFGGVIAPSVIDGNDIILDMGGPWAPDPLSWYGIFTHPNDPRPTTDFDMAILSMNAMIQKTRVKFK